MQCGPLAADAGCRGVPTSPRHNKTSSRLCHSTFERPRDPCHLEDRRMDADEDWVSATLKRIRPPLFPDTVTCKEKIMANAQCIKGLAVDNGLNRWIVLYRSRVDKTFRTSSRENRLRR
eukprot:scaffold185262_cov37-Attheya_sp.AAC.1